MIIYQHLFILYYAESVLLLYNANEMWFELPGVYSLGKNSPLINCRIHLRRIISIETKVFKLLTKCKFFENNLIVQCYLYSALCSDPTKGCIRDNVYEKMEFVEINELHRYKVSSSILRITERYKLEFSKAD